MQLNAIMKNLFIAIAEAISKGGRSEINQSPNGLQNITLGKLRVGRPSLKGLNRSAQSGWSPVHRHDESAFMKFQLG